LTTADQDAVLKMLDSGAFPVDPRRGATFTEILIRHTLEGCFSPPEYGGNTDTQGWQLAGLEGDVQPLGYSIFSTSANDYVERADHPMSTANPDELGPGDVVQAKPIATDSRQIQMDISTLTNLAFGDACKEQV
jgi:hypothetical protein